MNRLHLLEQAHRLANRLSAPGPGGSDAVDRGTFGSVAQHYFAHRSPESFLQLLRSLPASGQGARSGGKEGRKFERIRKDLEPLLTRPDARPEEIAYILGWTLRLLPHSAASAAPQGGPRHGPPHRPGR